MLETLRRGFRDARLSLQGKARLTDDNIADALGKVRTSLLEADVELSVVRAFLDRVRERAVGEVVHLKAPTGAKGVPAEFKATPADHFIKICHDELVQLMGPVDTSLQLDGDPAIIMMVGLQGSGKTTTAGKIAYKLLKEGHKPLLVAADVYRPAAIDQLMTIGRKLGVPVFSIKGMKPVDLCRLAVNQARSVGRDVVIFDTAGRLAIDERLMAELDEIKATTHPQNILFVCDAMIGQDAVRTATEFDRRLDFTGFVLTKLDGDARGGAALSIKEVTGKPIKFLGMGEGLGKLQEFRPEGLADRILGFGDIVGLMQDFEEVIDHETAEQDALKMLKGQFTFDDFLKQIGMIQKMGSLRSLFERIPFMGELLEQLPPEALDDRELGRVRAMIQSMTPMERKYPDLLDDSRIARIARGSGHTVEEVRQLYDRFLEARKVMGEIGQSGLFSGMGIPGLGGGRAHRRKAARGGGMPDLSGMLPPGAMGGMPALPGLDSGGDDEIDPEEKARQARQRRARRNERKRAERRKRRKK